MVYIDEKIWVYIFLGYKFLSDPELFGHKNQCIVMTWPILRSAARVTISLLLALTTSRFSEQHDQLR